MSMMMMMIVCFVLLWKFSVVCYLSRNVHYLARLVKRHVARHKVCGHVGSPAEHVVRPGEASGTRLSADTAQQESCDQEKQKPT